MERSTAGACAARRGARRTSAIAEMETPPTMGRSERKMGSVTGGASERKSTVSSIVASGSPALTVSTKEALTAPNAPFVMQKPSE